MARQDMAEAGLSELVAPMSNTVEESLNSQHGSSGAASAAEVPALSASTVKIGSRSCSAIGGRNKMEPDPAHGPRMASGLASVFKPPPPSAPTLNRSQGMDLLPPIPDRPTPLPDLPSPPL